MFPGEEKDRQVVEKVIAATQKGEIRWRAGDADFNQRFYALWHGYSLCATYFQDETSFEMRKKGEQTFRASYRTMEGLREAILEQLPEIIEAERNRAAQAQAVHERHLTGRAATIEDILALP